MLTIADMLQAYQPAAGDYRLMVGFEYEVRCLDGRTGRPLDHNQLVALLVESAQRLDGTLIEEPVLSKVSLPDGAMISLEPGGQFEYSSAPAPTFFGCLAQLSRFVELLRHLRSTFGVHLFFGGVDPVHRPDEIGLVVPNNRYCIMDDYFGRVGTMGRRMMRQSCSVQVTFDYQNPDIGEDLLRTAFHVSPFAAAAFANAPFVDGRATGYRSYRTPIWEHTDPSRCGMLPNFSRATFEDYLRHVVAAPMFFVRVDDKLVDAQGMTFAEFNARGFAGRAATLDDFLLHNSTIFTDVRLKSTVEVRSIDGQDPALLPAVLAFLSGLLLCNTARAAAKQALQCIDPADYDTVHDRLAREGLSGRLAGRATRDILVDLIEVSRDGLVSCFPDGISAGEHLQPLRELVVRGKTPADVVLERYGNARAWLDAGRTFTDGELPGPPLDL